MQINTVYKQPAQTSPSKYLSAEQHRFIIILTVLLKQK